MGIVNELKNDVAIRNIAGIRADLWSCIAIDPNFTKDFGENWDYCLSNGISESDLYENHDNRPISDEVTIENFSLLCGQLRTNFSKERLDKIKEIGRKLYPPTEEKAHSQTSATHSYENQRTNMSSSSNQVDGDSGISPKLGICIAVGAIGGGLIGGLIFKKIIVGAIAGAAIGGVAGAKFFDN